MTFSVYHWFKSAWGDYCIPCSWYWSVGLECPHHREEEAAWGNGYSICSSKCY